MKTKLTNQDTEFLKILGGILVGILFLAILFIVLPMALEEIDNRTVVDAVSYNNTSPQNRHNIKPAGDNVAENAVKVMSVILGSFFVFFLVIAVFWGIVMFVKETKKEIKKEE